MKRKRFKIKLKGLIIVLILILLGVLIFLGYRNLKVKNIYVVGNKVLRESEIIELVNLKDYPYLYTISTSKIIDSLKTNPLINSVKVKKTLLGKIEILIEENRILYEDLNGKYALSNNQKIDKNKVILGIPTLTNECEEEKLIKKLVLIDEDILNKISEIEYRPNDLDKERFMFYMNDGNYVYVTLSKMNLINSYNEIYPTLEGKKGILYLDSGNHFEIKKDVNG